jgi:hypothetical protein
MSGLGRSAVAEIINLNRARKAKAGDLAKARAAANRASFGRTKAEKARAEAEKAKAEAALDAHKREP